MDSSTPQKPANRFICHGEYKLDTYADYGIAKFQEVLAKCGGDFPVDHPGLKSYYLDNFEKYYIQLLYRQCIVYMIFTHKEAGLNCVNEYGNGRTPDVSNIIEYMQNTRKYPYWFNFRDYLNHPYHPMHDIRKYFPEFWVDLDFYRDSFIDKIKPKFGIKPY